VRFSDRFNDTPDYTNNLIGFRVARKPPFAFLSSLSSVLVSSSLTDESHVLAV
jgi:hypothetical protein